MIISAFYVNSSTILNKSSKECSLTLRVAHYYQLCNRFMSKTKEESKPSVLRKHLVVSKTAAKMGNQRSCTVLYVPTQRELLSWFVSKVLYR